MSVIASSLYVYSADRQRLGEVRSITSLQWLEIYAGVGEAKLVCGATPNNRALLTNGVLLHNTDRPELLALVQQVTIDDDERTAKMTVRACLTACRLAERVVMYTETFSGAEAGMLAIVEHNLRGLPITVQPAKGYTEALEGQVSWGSVLEAVTAIAAAVGLGYRVVVNSAMNEAFEVYKGVDRTVPGSGTYAGYFGDDAGNLAGITLTDDLSAAKNVAIVCGRGEGTARRVVEVDMSDGGEHRELYVDADDIEQTSTVQNEDGSTAEHTCTEEEYDALLRARGLEKLAGLTGGLAVKAELAQTMLLFGQDYELGDILPLRVSKYGVAAKARVTQVKIVYEQTKAIEAILEVVT